MTKTTDSLPEYLRKVCTVQDYSLYTPRQQESWRYIMKQALPFFKTLYPYTKKDFVNLPYIQTACRTSTKWTRACSHLDGSAATIQGFIPPWAFLEFQSRKILPIATDMRQISHIAYTPAPDIVHEAAGHAPILCDSDYSNYLSDYAKIGLKGHILS